jgi:hypothetical protein
MPFEEDSIQQQAESQNFWRIDDLISVDGRSLSEFKNGTATWNPLHLAVASQQSCLSLLHSTSVKPKLKPIFIKGTILLKGAQSQCRIEHLREPVGLLRRYFKLHLADKTDPSSPKFKF